MKRYLTFGIIFGVLVIVIVIISWFGFPAWKSPASGGFWTLLGLVIVGVFTFVKDLVSVWKDLKEEPKPSAPAPTQSINSQQGENIYNAPGGTINVYQPAGSSAEPTPELNPLWHLAHPYPMPPNFTGRVAERAMLTHWLNEDAENHLFIIRALGGFGKSALSWHWLTHDVDSTQWTKLVWWSFYEGDASFEHFIEETLKYLKLEVPQGQRPQVDQLFKAMQSQKILLIMDGFERALRAYSSMNAAYQGDEPKIEDNQLDCVNINAEIFLKSVCSLPNIKSKVLMTTRLTPRAVKPRGEFMLGCHEVELTSMQPADAVEFFRKQKIKGTHAEIEAACAPYGYHPLSLRLLAGRILKDFENPADISVAQKFKIDGDIIQQKNHVLEVSYNSLTPHEQKLLSTIACFRSPVALETLQSIAENKETLNNDLQDLRERGLLHFDDKNKKFDLHPIVRRYSYERLTKPDRIATHTRLVDYFEAISEPAKAGKLEDLAPVIELYHHIIRTNNYDDAYNLYIDRLHSTIFLQFGAYQLIIELLQTLFVDGIDKPPRLKDDSAKALTLNALSQGYGMSGQPAKAIPLLNQQISIFEKLDSTQNLGVSLGNQSDWLRAIGSLHAATSNLQRRVKLSKEARDEFREAIGHLALGHMLSYHGAWDEAEQELDHGLSLFQKVLSTKDWISKKWSYHAQLSILKHDIVKAIDYANKALEFSKQDAEESYPLERDFIRDYWLLGSAYRLNGQLTNAEQFLSEAFSRCRAINLVETEANIILDLARLRYDQKNYEEAKSLAEEALSITERCGYVLQGADVNLFLAQYALEQEQDKVKAKAYAEAAKKLATCDGPPYYYKVAYEEAERFLENL
jgi:tetratricopeptide (TPR) repeat protein